MVTAATAGSVELQVPLKWKSPLATVDIYSEKGGKKKRRPYCLKLFMHERAAYYTMTLLQLFVPFLLLKGG